MGRTKSWAHGVNCWIKTYAYAFIMSACRSGRCFRSLTTMAESCYGRKVLPRIDRHWIPRDWHWQANKINYRLNWLFLNEKLLNLWSYHAQLVEADVKSLGSKYCWLLKPEVGVRESVWLNFQKWAHHTREEGDLIGAHQVMKTKRLIRLPTR